MTTGQGATKTDLMTAVEQTLAEIPPLDGQQKAEIARILKPKGASSPL